MDMIMACPDMIWWYTRSWLAEYDLSGHMITRLLDMI